MGNFYTNFAVKIPDAGGVAAALKKAARSALVSPATGGYVVVFDEVADTQDTDAITRVGTLLSGQLACAVFAILNHDDDVLCYWLFDGGKRIDTYNSKPDYWDDAAGTDRGGDVETLCRTLGVPQAAEAVRNILYEEDYVFALEQHAALIAALHLPEWTVAGGFNYIEQGETLESLDADSLIRTP